jgi:hypothetical protein
MHNNQFEDILRDRMTDLVPLALDQAIFSYATFINQPIPVEEKEFAQFHKACKAALQHIDTLAKLTRWMGEGDGEKQADRVEKMIAAAKTQLTKIDQAENKSDGKTNE